MTKADAAELVAILADAFPSARVTERTCQVYEAMLVDLDQSTAQRAVARLVATSKFLPTIAEIRAAVVDGQHGPRRLGAEAYGDVLAEIRRVGTYDLPTFSDPLVAECVRQMGWEALCRGTNDAADRARFVELYDGLSVRARADEVAGASLALPPPRATAALLGSVGRALPAPASRPSARQQIADVEKKLRPRE